jgi:hypothetical protein
MATGEIFGFCSSSRRKARCCGSLSSASRNTLSNLFEISKDKPNLSHGEMMREATLDLLNAATTDEDARPRVWALRRHRRTRESQQASKPSLEIVIVGSSGE